MRKFLPLAVLVLAITFTACENKKAEANVNLPAGTNKNVNLPAGTHKIEVVDFIQTPNYTYIKSSENGNEYWIAVTKMQPKKGETLYFSKSMEMRDFKSETLNRTFESILFVEDISQGPPAAGKPLNHPQVFTQNKKDIKIEPLKDGKTVAQIYQQKNNLAGQNVEIKGEVVKYNPNIMGRNWIHIQDGTGHDNNYDLMVTSADSVKTGDVVVVEGTVEINQDFGAGYSYPVLLSNAKLKVQ